MTARVRVLHAPTAAARRHLRAACTTLSLYSGVLSAALLPTVRKGGEAAALPSAPPAAIRRYTRPATRTTVADLLAVSKQFRSKQTHYILQDQTLSDAVKYLAKNENSATLVVVNEQHQVVGMITNHIVLEKLSKMKGKSTKDWNAKVSEIAIPARDILHVSPEDSLENCRAVMALSGRGELPVLEGDKLLGTVSLTDIASLLHRLDAQLNTSPTSAKSDYINLILPRKGLPTNTSLDESAAIEKDITKRWEYYLHSFAMSIPHPAKRETGGEDAYFVGTLEQDDETNTRKISKKVKSAASAATTTNGSGSGSGNGGGAPPSAGPADVLTLGVADGVGSWFERGVSAREYAQELMKAAHKAVQISYAKDHRIDPSEVLHAAWATVLQKEIVGSSTACVIALDPQSCELHAINLGDSGFLIIRDKKSDRETARQRGTLDGSLMRKIRDRESDLTPAGRRKGAHISYRSPQQLHYFNCPFQLGFVGPQLRKDVTKDLNSYSSPSPMNEKPLFETPENGVKLRVPVLEGDLIILATDGLFDNVDEEQLLDIVVAEPELEAMTKKLVQKAYDLSLDRTRDSPFARLAKENDLLWGGGMPDDITIIAARVTKHRADDTSVAAAATLA